MVANISSAARSRKAAAVPPIRSVVAIAARRLSISRRDRVALKAVIHAEPSSRVSKAQHRNISRHVALLGRSVVRKCIAEARVVRKASVVRARREDSMARADLSRVFSTINAAQAGRSLDRAKLDAVPAARRTSTVP